MGAAESVLASPIEMLTKTYGGDFAKFVCAEKAK